MTPETRRKLSIAFTVYNRARAQARRQGDTKQIDLWNKTLGRMVKVAFHHRAATSSKPNPISFAQA